MIETRTVEVQLANGTVECCVVEIAHRPASTVIFSGLGFERREFVAADFFGALVTLRQELEKLGARPLCLGACTDVFPSGMSRSMSAGRKAYRLRLGSPTDARDLVDIFDRAEPQAVGSVDEQERFHATWAESLKRKR